MVEIHKLPISIWYIPSKAIAVAARTSSVESRGAVPESDEYEKIQIINSLNQSNTGKALIFHIFTIFVIRTSGTKTNTIHGTTFFRNNSPIAPHSCKLKQCNEGAK